MTVIDLEQARAERLQRITDQQNDQPADPQHAAYWAAQILATLAGDTWLTTAVDAGAGPCDDCTRTAPRYGRGVLELCYHCARSRDQCNPDTRVSLDQRLLALIALQHDEDIAETAAALDAWAEAIAPTKLPASGGAPVGDLQQLPSDAARTSSPSASTGNIQGAEGRSTEGDS